MESDGSIEEAWQDEGYWNQQLVRLVGLPLRRQRQKADTVISAGPSFSGVRHMQEMRKYAHETPAVNQIEVSCQITAPQNPAVS